MITLNLSLFFFFLSSALDSWQIYDLFYPFLFFMKLCGRSESHPITGLTDNIKLSREHGWSVKLWWGFPVPRHHSLDRFNFDTFYSDITTFYTTDFISTPFSATVLTFYCDSLTPTLYIYRIILRESLAWLYLNVRMGAKLTKAQHKK